MGPSSPHLHWSLPSEQENVYLLLSRLADSNSSSDWAAAGSWGSSSRCFAVVISNADKCIPIWHQRASVDPAHQPVLWDYHGERLLTDDEDEAGTGGGGEGGAGGADVPCMWGLGLVFPSALLRFHLQ